jgi:hypothetical protein
MTHHATRLTWRIRVCTAFLQDSQRSERFSGPTDALDAQEPQGNIFSAAKPKTAAPNTTIKPPASRT